MYYIMYRDNRVIECYGTVHIIYKEKCDDFYLISLTERNQYYQFSIIL